MTVYRGHFSMCAEFRRSWGGSCGFQVGLHHELAQVLRLRATGVL
jgi:hypothetical protein